MSAVPETDAVRVVIVDDTPDLREVLRFALERHEFRVVGEAADGRGGIARVEQTRPDLVLLDLAMPVMDGFEALPHVRRACARSKIVVLSGFDTGATAARAHDLGADGYLQKGASLTSTIDYLREVLGPRHLGLAPPPALALVADPEDEPAASTGTPPALPAWLAAVPFGVVLVDDDADLLVRAANPAAAAVLGAPVQVDEPLTATHAALADLASRHRGESVVQLEVPGDPSLVVTMTRTDEGLALVLLS